MKRIFNPYGEESMCFACAPSNEHGLHMTFCEDGDEVLCVWTPKEHFVGFGNMLHGGIQATLMDEIACWYINVKEGTTGVTSGMQVRYRKPCIISLGDLSIRASLLGKKRNLISIKVMLYDGEGQLCSEAEVQYFTFSEEHAKAHFAYPGQEAFFAVEEGTDKEGS